MLGTVMVHLQTQAGTGIDDNAFDLKAITEVDGVIPAPRTIDLTVGVRERAAFLLESGHDFLDTLRVALVCYQHGIGCFDHDNIVEPYRSDKTSACMYQ